MRTLDTVSTGRVPKMNPMLVRRSDVLLPVAGCLWLAGCRTGGSCGAGCASDVKLLSSNGKSPFVLDVRGSNRLEIQLPGAFLVSCTSDTPVIACTVM